MPSTSSFRPTPAATPPRSRFDARDIAPVSGLSVDWEVVTKRARKSHEEEARERARARLQESERFRETRSTIPRPTTREIRAAEVRDTRDRFVIRALALTIAAIAALAVLSAFL